MKLLGSSGLVASVLKRGTGGHRVVVVASDHLPISYLRGDASDPQSSVIGPDLRKGTERGTHILPQVASQVTGFRVVVSQCGRPNSSGKVSF